MSYISRPLVEEVLNQMREIIRENGLKLMDLYPNDLNVQERIQLDAWAYPGMQFGWMVGDHRTAVIPLGVHPDNKTSWYTNLAESDCFFHITISISGKPVIKKVTRDQFVKLESVRIPYAIEMTAENRVRVLKSSEPIADVRLTYVGSVNNPRFKAEFSPKTSLNEVDRNAVSKWLWRHAAHLAGTLWATVDETWPTLA